MLPHCVHCNSTTNILANTEGMGVLRFANIHLVLEEYSRLYLTVAVWAQGEASHCCATFPHCIPVLVRPEASPTLAVYLITARFGARHAAPRASSDRQVRDMRHPFLDCGIIRRRFRVLIRTPGLIRPTGARHAAPLF